MPNRNLQVSIGARASPSVSIEQKFEVTGDSTKSDFMKSPNCNDHAGSCGLTQYAIS